MMTQEVSRPNIPPSETQEMDDEFQFLLCERCQKEVESPKLLSCLHNLCTECLEECKPIGLCPICRTPYSQNAGTPNVLFVNLQAKLRIYRKVTDGKGLLCDSCKKEEKAAEFWCSDCEEFLCVSCFQFHQRFLKKESHEAKSLKDLRAESSKDFLAGFRRLSVMSCSNHNNQPLREIVKTNPWMPVEEEEEKANEEDCAEVEEKKRCILTQKCRQSMCCTCALLDSKHTGQHCEIQKEIQCRQRELQSMNTELKKKKISYLDTWKNLKDLVEEKEKVKNETRLLIDQKVDVMLQLVQETREKLLTAVEEQHSQDIQDITEKLQHVKGMVRRMGSSERLVEKMHLYASDQELMDMHPFIRERLEELQSKQPPVLDLQVQAENYTEVKAELEDWFGRITKKKEAAPGILEKESQQDCSVNSPAKRKYVQEEKAIQTPPPKVIKAEPDDSEGKTSAGQVSCIWLEQPGTSSTPAGSGHAAEGGLGKIILRRQLFPCAISETSEPDDSSLDSCPEKESGDDEPLDAGLLQVINGKSESSQKEDAMCSISTPSLVQDTFVFFDLKIISGNILHLVAVGDNLQCFSVMFQLMYKGHAKSSPCEIGLDSFLHYLQSLHMPILVGYKIWYMDLPALISALEACQKDKIFETAIFGFLDALPLFKEKIPDAPSYTLKNLDHTYFFGDLDDSQAEGCAKSLRNLWTVLDVNPVVERNQVIAYSSLQCYTSLQPLLKEKFLSISSARTLALHNLSLSRLQSVYQNNPETGLRRLCRYLNSNLRDTEQKIKNLSKIQAYFQVLPSAAWQPSPAKTS